VLCFSKTGCHFHGLYGITDFSYPRPFERSLWGTFVPQERKFQELSFPGPFVPGTFRSRELWFPGNESSLELSFPGPFVSGTFCTRELSFPYLCALVYNSSLGAARLSVFDVPITVARRTKRLR